MFFFLSEFEWDGIRMLRTMVRRVYGVAPWLKPVARWVAGKSTGRCTPIGTCTECRLLDSVSSLEDLVRKVRHALADSGFDYIEHEISTDTQEFYVSDIHREQLGIVLDGLKNEVRCSVKRKTIALTANRYEVDGEELTLPERTECWDISPVGECVQASSLLGRWRIRVSFYTQAAHARVFHLRNSLVRVLPPDQLLPANLSSLWEATRSVECVGAIKQLEGTNFPIDCVYTWVDDRDLSWCEKRDRYNEFQSGSVDWCASFAPKSSSNSSRFRNRDELRYSLRSIYMYAPFFRNIYIVTDDQVPSWLRDDQRVRIVSHSQIFDDKTVYPAFSSRPIEFNLHRIDGLSEHFVYMNDDFFLCAPVSAKDFFHVNGVAKVFPSSRRLDSRKIQASDRATVAAHKNAAKAFERNFGVSPTGKYVHAPYAVRRSACFELEEVFRPEVDIAKGNRFRCWDDVSWSFVTPHYMVLKGYAVPDTIKSRYVDIADVAAVELLTGLNTLKDTKSLCINDTDDVVSEKQESWLVDWMAARWPVRPPWEKPEHA